MPSVLRKALHDAVAASGGPGAVAYVGHRDETVFWEAAGALRRVPDARATARDTLYDLASLTKTVGTTTAVMLLRDRGVLDLDQPVYEWLPAAGFRRFTLRHCLTHTAGLPSGLPFWKDASSLLEMLARYAAAPLAAEPGTRRVYSDVGFMVLGQVVELAAGDRLDAFCRRCIFEPLGMARTGFNPAASCADQCAATEDSAWRGGVMQGVVHDENAYVVGGVAGHAGLFAPADDLARFCRALLAESLLPGATLDEMTRLGQVPAYPWQGLGWKLDPWRSGSEGFVPARTAFGHTGWTGTSLWMDRASGLFVILLGNTCHPSRDARDNAAFRRVFHEPVAESCCASRANVHTGLDRLVWDGFSAVRGKRIGLLTNLAAVDELGRSVLDVLALEPGLRLTAVYGPEHGLRGQAEAGERVPSERGPVPVISLYGGQKEPAPGELAAMDLFVVHLPDVGSRYYTYMATMLDALRACARAGVPVLVLDRPNPLGGDVIEGPVAAGPFSPVCYAPIPIRHGMTPGELAHFARKTRLVDPALKLDIALLDGWRPALLFEQCSLPWVAPSPNMPTAETALLYAGTCLFEGVNVNEGRGTDTPFHLFGAPWLDPEAVLRRIRPEDCAGCRLEPVTYTPRSLPGRAANPRYRDEVCQGLRVHVEAPGSVRAVTLAVALLQAIRAAHGDALTWTRHFDALAGSPDLRHAILDSGGGSSPSAAGILRRYERELARFDRIRPRLY